MQSLTGVMYDSRPKDVTVSPTIIDVVTLCEPVNVKDEQTNKTYVKYKCDVERYTPIEYIDKLRSENVSLSSQATQLELALVEVYEMILG